MDEHLLEVVQALPVAVKKGIPNVKDLKIVIRRFRIATRY
jgi:hypothetical protein